MLLRASRINFVNSPTSGLFRVGADASNPKLPSPSPCSTGPLSFRRARRFEATPDYIACGYCAFRDICQNRRNDAWTHPDAGDLSLRYFAQLLQLDGKVLHVDFHEVAENEKVTVQVPVETVGEAAGVKNSGGVLEHVLFKLKARGLPKDLPEVILVDVSHLKIGQSIHSQNLQAIP